MRVVFTKYDGSLHWHHPARLLGEDEHGVWVGCEAGTLGAKGDGPPVTWDKAFVMLLPREEGWVALFNEPGHSTEVYVDVSTVPVWSEDMVTMVDLDLDVIRRATGEVFLDDADEFAEHQVTFGYPPEVIEAAERSAAWLMEAVSARKGPFGGAHEAWLAQVL
ncbi:DUF402 domain-containing protein [Nonomuraea sp. NPDC050310]|uniref:DUF402 domain-containing protein n=1 Tax=unclassified Nonomuraea TaxID=2593643 RepID=UPI0033D881DF